MCSERIQPGKFKWRVCCSVSSLFKNWCNKLDNISSRLEVMDDSSDFEFDNLLENVKSTCKKKSRSKNAFHDKLHQSCPQKLQSTLKNIKCEMPEIDTLKIGNRQNTDFTARTKTKTPKVKLRFQLISSDEDSDDSNQKLETKFSEKVTIHGENGISASSKLQSCDVDRNRIPKAGKILPDLVINAKADRVLMKSPCQTPKQNLMFLFDDDLPDGEVKNVVVEKFQNTSRVLQNISEQQHLKRNCQSTVNDNDSEVSTPEEIVDYLNFKTPKKNVWPTLLKDEDFTIFKTPKTNLNLKTCDDSHEGSAMKNNCLKICASTPRISSKASRKVISPDSSDDENIIPSSQFHSQQTLNVGDFDTKAQVENTPTTKVHVPGLKNGYFGSTSRKTPKSSIKFLVGCLDNTHIESDADDNGFDVVKENMTMDINLDYSKPVPIKLYTKAGVNDFLAALSPNSRILNYDSRKYVSRYFEEKTDLTNVLYYFFNKFVFDNQLPQYMPIYWKSGMTSTAGYCHCKRNHGTSSRCCTIKLSEKLLDSPDKLRDTLIHELCHAAVHLISNERDVHGPFWRVWTKTANLAFPDLPFITRCHDYKHKK